MTTLRTRDRHSIRLRGFDYSEPGMYSVTICAAERRSLFGHIQDGALCLNEIGRIVQDVWRELPDHYAGLQTDAFVVMPNHIHGILILHRPGVVGVGVGVVGAGFKPALDVPPPSVGAGFKPAPTTHGAHATGAKRHRLNEIVRGFKTFSARRVNDLRGTHGALWQRNYYEHIIRNGDSLDQIRRYILENPARWEFDRENPESSNPVAARP